MMPVLSVCLSIPLLFLYINEVSAKDAYLLNVSYDLHKYKIEFQNESLETVSESVRQGTNVVQIDIKITNLLLKANVTFVNQHSVTINGEPVLTTISCTNERGYNAGIVFRDIADMVRLNNLKFVFCGSNIKRSDYTAALILVYCRNVEISGVIVERSKGIGLMIENHRGGVVNIKSSSFKENQLPQEKFKESVLGGGGIHIELGHILKQNYSLMSFHFSDCVFKNNVAHTKHYKFLYRNIHGEVKEGYGRGGGVNLSIKDGFQDAKFSFSNCTFIGNQAYVGGGLAITTRGGSFDQKTTNITVEIKDSLFERNGCHNAKFGGGLSLFFPANLSSILLYKSVLSNCHYLVSNVTFSENCATLGGGVVYFSDRSRKDDQTNSVIFDQCTFKQNKAHLGSAVDMIPNIYFKLSAGFVLAPKFINCQFLKNRVKVQTSQDGNQMTAGIGTIHASLFNINFHGYNHFESNWGTAIYVINGFIDFQNSSVSFKGNIGLQGGAIALIGSSTMIVGPQNEYLFANNIATHQGGAIYVQMIDSTDFTFSRSCFIQYVENDKVVLSNDWNTNITFTGNKLKYGLAGHAIYTTSIHSCQVTSGGSGHQPEYTLVNISEVFTIKGVTFDSNVRLQPQIATEGAVFKSTKSLVLKVIPGEEYQHGVIVIDDMGHEVNESFRVTIQRNNTNNKVSLDSSLSSFIGDTMKLTGRPAENATLHLHLMSPRHSYINLSVVIQHCPPGFVLDDNSGCICDTQSYVGLFYCDLHSYHSHLLPGYWVGVIEYELVTSACPYCDYNKSLSNTSQFSLKVILPHTYHELDEAICGETRTGTVCGRCRENYTVHFHSPGFLCKPAEPVGCKLGWLFYILSELVPVTVVFVIILVFNISFTSGVTNGFILFCQLLRSLDVDANHINILADTRLKGYRLVYGFFDLNFFDSESLSFCLWKHASAIDMVAFKYVTIIYTLLLIVAVVWIMDKCGGRYCGKYCRITAIRTSVIHGITTFLVICYAECVWIFLKLLNPVHLYTKDGSIFQPSPRVWLNGDLVYFSKQHLPYALPAIFSLITIGLFPPALLLIYPLFNKLVMFFGCDDMKVVNLISQKLFLSSLKPLFDSFQGCFKDNLRFFAGLYFLYRWVILLIDMNTINYGSYYTSVTIALLAILILHVLCQPYTKKAHNVIDTLLFADLMFINIISFYSYHKNQYQSGIKPTTTAPIVFQLMLIYLPLIIMGVYVVTILCNKVIKYKATNSLLSKIDISTKLRKLMPSFSMKDGDADSLNSEELIQDRLTLDEDSDFSNTCKYFRASSNLETSQLDMY